MEEHLEGVAFPPTAMSAAEGQMVRADLVREIVARRERGESTRQIARELAVDRKTVRRWLRIGGWQPRQGGERPRAIDPYLEFIERMTAGTLSARPAAPRAGVVGLTGHAHWQLDSARTPLSI